MAFLCPTRKLAYFPVPKVAGTAIKFTLYELEYRKPFEQKWNGDRWLHIHDVYVTKPFSNADKSDLSEFTRFVMIRDPIDRLMSAYANRVLALRELSSEALDRHKCSELGLVADPDADFFFGHIDQYMYVSDSIKHHMESISNYTGDDLSFFTRVFKFEQFSELPKFFSETFNCPVTVRREQESQLKLKFESLSKITRDKILKFLREDYELLKDYYKPR